MDSQGPSQRIIQNAPRPAAGCSAIGIVFDSTDVNWQQMVRGWLAA